MTLDASPQTGRRHEANPYAELKRLVKEEGLLDRQPAYFGGKIALNALLLAVGLALLPILDNTWLQLANAVYLAFVFVQISFLAHDFGHRQFSFRAPWKNDWATLILGNLLLGVSRQWWIDKHNDHHGHPNQMDVDPDVDIPLLAFEEEQAFEKRGFARFVVKYQAVLIFPLSLLQSISMLRSSVEFLAGKKARRPLTEASLIVAHFALYFGGLFLFLEPLQALLFVAVHRGLFGLFMVSVFAPNHKAMPTLERDSEVDFLHRQVLTSRNVTAHPITDFWYGGLNYQIEHHLFPRLPRNKLREAQAIVRDFCRQHAIDYHETSVLQSYREILHHLHEVGAPLRKSPQSGL
ncbi:MAG TPA: fatty acid desaturase [Rubrobacter sp.]|nr:fatty acid desaturase [Rubrobacter sp.]